ncbi:hypothetical protein [Pajaroellobacter abortibovis]|nr:hypothetical protein [Pajaroellobacter abortibovis]
MIHSPQRLLGRVGVARLVLALELSLTCEVNTTRVALAICSQRVLMHAWILAPSKSSLATRRFAAQLIEGVGRQRSGTGALQGDECPFRLFEGGAIGSILKRLFADRDPSCWRYASVARGLLYP